MSTSAGLIDARLVRAVSGFALGTALLLAAAVPAIHYVAATARLEVEMRAEAGATAIGISDYVARNPELWRFQAVRIAGLIDQGHSIFPHDDKDEAWRILDEEGRLVVERPAEVPMPWITVEEPVFDSGRPVGTVQVIRSQREVLAQTGWFAIGSALLGGLAFLALRAVPLRLLRRAVERSHHLATHDQLTGLPNRTLFRDRLGQAAAAARRDGLPLAVLALDLDRFKETNDTLGHAAGDELLRQVARRLASGVRESDTVARLGGDEFAIIQRSATQPRDAEALARRLIAAVAEPYDLFGNQVTIGVSIGIALGQAGAPEELLRDADTALYRAKAEGRNTFRFFEAAMNAALRERRAMERDLRQALATGQLRLHFQPQVDLPSGRAVGLEALLRWAHPERGLLPPSAFIDLAEETGLLTAMGEWVLREACAVALRWPGLRMAVNISASQFQGTDFVRSVRQALAATGLEPGRLEIEITEGVLLTDTERTLEVLEALHALGVSVAMDDFGTGYSSLGYLQKFRFDKIKIDRRFVEHLGEDPRAMAIVRAVLGITQALGVRANAEGVERHAEAELLAAEGCAEAQGYLFGRPVPEAELAALIGEIGRARAA